MQAVSPQNTGSLIPIKQSPPAAHSDTTAGRNMLNRFDLNDSYVDSDDGMEVLERSPVTENYACGSADYPPWARHDSRHSSLLQNSIGEAQILDWLAHSPTDIEGYIKSGCIILTVYLRLPKSMWEEVCYDLSSCISRLFYKSDDSFWSAGWMFVRVQNQIALVHDGYLLLVEK